MLLLSSYGHHQDPGMFANLYPGTHNDVDIPGLAVCRLVRGLLSSRTNGEGSPLGAPAASRSSSIGMRSTTKKALRGAPAASRSSSIGMRSTTKKALRIVSLGFPAQVLRDGCVGNLHTLGFRDCLDTPRGQLLGVGVIEQIGEAAHRSMSSPRLFRSCWGRRLGGCGEPDWGPRGGRTLRA